MEWREAWERAARSVSERGSFVDVPASDRIALARELLSGFTVQKTPPIVIEDDRGPTMTDRCEPPEELRGRDGWHWVKMPDDAEQCWEWDAEEKGWWEPGGSMAMDLYVKGGWRYVAPVTPPAVVAALAEALAEMMSALAHSDRRSLAMGFRFLRATSNARAALAAYREGRGC